MSFSRIIQFRPARGTALFLLSVFLIFPCGSAFPGAGDPTAVKTPASISLAEVDNTLKAFERMESSGEKFFPAPFGDPEKPRNVAEEINKAEEALRIYMEKQPDDPKAMLLKARLLRARDASSPSTYTSGPGREPQITGSRHTAEIHRLLDAVLAKEPGNADAHYWKSRVVNTRELAFVDNAVGFTPWDSKKSLHHASRAHELAPGNIVYREYYAQNLLAAGKADDVIGLMKDVEGGNHPLYRLLTDWRAIPKPDNVMFDERMTNAFVEMASMSDDRPEYPQLRFAAFVLFGNAATIEGFYKGKFGKFKLSPQPGSGPDGPMRMLAAFLEWKEDALVPVEGFPDSNEKRSGVMIMVMEHPNPPPNVRMMYNAPEGTSVTQLMITNMRKFRKGD